MTVTCYPVRPFRSNPSVRRPTGTGPYMTRIRPIPSYPSDVEPAVVSRPHSFVISAHFGGIGTAALDPEKDSLFDRMNIFLCRIYLFRLPYSKIMWYYVAKEIIVRFIDYIALIDILVTFNV